MKRTNKRGIDVMVSYVLLIVIAVAISALVYSYLKSYFPGKQIECQPDISLIAEQFSCNGAARSLELKISNHGLFNVSGAYIRFGEEGRTTRKQINKRDELFLPDELAPGESTPLRYYSIGETLKENVTNYLLEIQPAVYQDFQLVPCSNVIITQPVFCGDISSAVLECTIDNDCESADGLFCNGNSTCLGGICQGGTAIDCGADFCSESLNSCVECLTASNCDDGIHCNGLEQCSSGTCQSGTPVSCQEDSLECTTTFCNEETNSCDIDLTTCGCPEGSDEECNNGLICDGIETCNLATRTCQPGNSMVCDDGISCTSDSCSELLGSCVYSPDDSLCDDGSSCTSDSCDSSLGCINSDLCPGQCYGEQCCISSTCSSLGYSCGGHSDGCGGILNCGSCTPPEVCGSNGQCCTPSPANCNGLCGTWGNGCGGTLNCGNCPVGNTCSTIPPAPGACSIITPT